MRVHHPDPVIQIIDDDQENVRVFPLISYRIHTRRQESHHQQKKGEETPLQAAAGERESSPIRRGGSCRLHDAGVGKSGWVFIDSEDFHGSI